MGGRALTAATVALALLIGTVVRFTSALTIQPVQKRAIVGLVLALGAFPTTCALAIATVETLNDLGVYW